MDARLPRKESQLTMATGWSMLANAIRSAMRPAIAGLGDKDRKNVIELIEGLFGLLGAVRAQIPIPGGRTGPKCVVVGRGDGSWRLDSSQIQRVGDGGGGGQTDFYKWHAHDPTRVV